MTLKMLGTTLVIGTFWPFERVLVVNVREEVVRESDSVGDGD